MTDINAKLKLRACDISNLSLENIPEPDYIIDNMLERGSLTMLYGDPGAGKTWVAMDMAIAIAAGGAFLDNECEPGRVLWLNQDMAHYLILKRTALLCNGRAITDMPALGASLFYISNHVPRLVFNSKAGKAMDSAVGRFTEAVGHYKPDVIVLDSLGALSGGQDENTSAVMPFLDYLRDLTASGISVVFIHHANKSGGYRGFSGILAQVDNSWKVEKSGDMFTISEEKKRDREEEAITARLSSNSTSVVLTKTGNATPTGKGDFDAFREAVIDALYEKPGLNQTEIIDLTKARVTAGQNKIRDWLKSLEKHDWITTETGAHNAKLFSLASRGYSHASQQQAGDKAIKNMIEAGLV